MGTSTSNSGQSGSTPLVPSWLDDIDTGIAPLNDPLKPTGDLTETSGTQQEPLKVNSEQPPLGRFTVPRNNFTRYIKSGGSGSGGGSLRRATSSYVKHSVGGSRNATKRLGSARQSTAKLFSVVSGFTSNGVSVTAQTFRLGDIIGKPAKNVFLHIMDFVCPDGGTTEEGIARSAYIEALVVMPDWDNKTIENLTASEFLAFIEIYMANVIEERIVNDIGNKLITLSTDVEQIDILQQQMKEFIGGAVLDAISKLNVDISKINTSQTQDIVDSVYRTAFDIMSNLED